MKILYNKIHFVHAKQSLGAISVPHTKQFSEHTDSFEYRSRQAVIHSLKHEFLIDNWHLMNRMPNKIIRLFYRFFHLCGSSGGSLRFYISGRFAKQEQLERWRAKRESSGLGHRARFCKGPGVSFQNKLRLYMQNPAM